MASDRPTFDPPVAATVLDVVDSLILMSIDVSES